MGLSAMSLFVAPLRGSGFWWSPERQVIFHRSGVYVHEGWTPTSPSHDLAHLLVAMSSQLLWLPQGTDDEVRLAEYNAVFLEHLLSNAYNCVVLRSIAPKEVLANTLLFVRWFVEKHYAPFPVAPEEAYRQFCWGIDAAVVSSLAAYFFVLRARELQGGDGTGRWAMSVKSRVLPTLDRKGRKFQLLVQNELARATSRPLSRRT
jgi:hypothetical protein